MNEFGKYREEIPDDAQRPEAPKVKASNPEQVTRANDTSVGTPSQNPEYFLISLLRVTLFFDLFEYYASCIYVGKSIQAKIIKLKTSHPTLFIACCICDIIVRAIIIATLIVTSMYMLYKILR